MPKVVTRRRLEQDLNQRPTDRKPKCLTRCTTAPPCAELDEKKSPRRPLGLIIVTESRLTRSPRPRACQLHVITSVELGGRQARRDLTRLGVALASQSRRRYIDCYQEVFAPCLEHVLASRDEGFLITACIPTAGLLTGHSGHVDSYLMYRQLDTHCVSILTSPIC